MALWKRVANVFRGARLNREIDEEIQAHLEEAEARGRDPEEARRAFGPLLATREASRDVRLVPWLESLLADVRFAWRQLVKSKVTSVAAILSLGLAIGCCTSAFRVIDALLLRPLPVADPDRLRFLSYQYSDHAGHKQWADSFEYPCFRQLREAVRGQAELMAISPAESIGAGYGSGGEPERVYRQYVSGWSLSALGLKAAVGRLLTESDDLTPGAHPYAVLSHDYWQRRFGGDPAVVGRKFSSGATYEIVGVVERGFTGTDTGVMTDVFLPTMMNARAIANQHWSWFRVWAKLAPGVTEQAVHQTLSGALAAFRAEKAKSFGDTPRDRIEAYVNAPLMLEPAGAGVSNLQKRYRRPLAALAALVALVLLIACANVANLMTAQASARAREMSLRVSIGAGRVRLAQMMLVEGALVALLATGVGALLAWWSAPFVVSMIASPGNAPRLALPADARVLGFGAALAFAVTLLFALAPALRASGVRPASVLKGGEDPHGRRRLMNGVLAAQVAFCFLVHLNAGLLVSTFERLTRQPLGFVPEGLLALETVGQRDQPYPVWQQAADHLRTVSGVEGAALATFPLMSGNGWSNSIWVDGQMRRGVEPYFLAVSPGWFDTMRIAWVDGRDFRPEDTHPRVAIVNEAFARQFFGGRNPVGQTFEKAENNRRNPIQIVGWVRDVRYRNLREPIRPTVYVPFRLDSGKPEFGDRNWATLMVRVAKEPGGGIAALLRSEVPRARPELRVAHVWTQTELVAQHAIGERLLAVLSAFFAAVALVLAAVGLYGVLDYSVLRQRKEIGIRMALGAPAATIAGRVTREITAVLVAGSAAGLALGLASQRYLATLLYQVKGTELTMLVFPAATILAASLVAALVPVVRALRIDPASMLRSE